MNRPATRRMVLQLTARKSPRGLVLALHEAMAVTARAARQVGRPRSLFMAEAARRVTTTKPRPQTTTFPAAVSGTGGAGLEIGALISFRKNTRRTANVARMERMEGTRKAASQWLSGGIPAWKTTRFAGFEIGSTKLAALATKAQTKR